MDCQKLTNLYSTLLEKEVKFRDFYVGLEKTDDKEEKKNFRFTCLETEKEIESIIKELQSQLVISIKQAKKIFDTLEREKEGKTNVFGPVEVEKAFGIKLKAETIPPIPFAKEELEQAEKLGQFLVLRVDTAPDGQPLTMEKMHELLSTKLTDKKGKRIKMFDRDDDKGKLKDNTWYKAEDFYLKEKPNFAWALVSKEIIPDSTDKNYLEQTKEAVKYLEDEAFKGRPLPEEYREAIAEFRSLKDDEKRDKKKYEPKISKLNKLIRQSPAENLYDIMIYYQNNGERLLEKKWARTYASATDGGRVYVGDFDADGVRVYSFSDNYSVPRLGVVFSRKS